MPRSEFQPGAQAPQPTNRIADRPISPDVAPAGLRGRGRRGLTTDDMGDMPGILIVALSGERLERVVDEESGGRADGGPRRVPPVGNPTDLPCPLFRTGELNSPPVPMFLPMALTLDQIVEEAQQWPDDVVADLVDRLMLARHGVSDPALNPAWRSAVSRRVEEIRSGQVAGIPGEVVSARIRQIVGR